MRLKKFKVIELQDLDRATNNIYLDPSVIVTLQPIDKRIATKLCEVIREQTGASLDMSLLLKSTHATLSIGNNTTLYLAETLEEVLAKVNEA